MDDFTLKIERTWTLSAREIIYPSQCGYQPKGLQGNFGKRTHNNCCTSRLITSMYICYLGGSLCCAPFENASVLKPCALDCSINHFCYLEESFFREPTPNNLY